MYLIQKAEHFDHYKYVTVYIQEQASRREIGDLQRQLQSSQTLVADLQKTLHTRTVQRQVVWVDPNIGNGENSMYVCHLLENYPHISLFATASRSQALCALNTKKDATIYRAITSGSGGEEFVRKLRVELSVMCEVLVFCMSVHRHMTWARKYSHINVTDSSEIMRKFATWND